MKRRISFKYLIYTIFIHFITIIPIAAQAVSKIEWMTIDNVAIPIPPAEHPRLFLMASDVNGIRARLEHPVLKSVVDSLRIQSGYSLQLKLEWDAIQYLVSKDKILGRSIIDSALILLQQTELPQMGDAARVTGRMMVTGAIIYDWLYPLITNKEKDVFIRELIRLAKTLECGYPPAKQGSVTGHSSESFIMRDMLSAGIAIYDEFPEMYELAATRFFRDHVPVRNWLYNGHAYHQGDSYGPLRFSWDTYPLMIFSRMGVNNVYNPEQQYVPYFYLYTTRPDGQRMRAGDTYFHSGHGATHGRPWDQYVGTLFTAGYYKDGILLDQFLRQGGSDGKAHGRINQREYIFQFLWRDLELQAQSITTLPLSRYFGPPFGWMVARTGWDENSVISEMKINVYNFSNHQHLDAGAFQIYYRGPLATESGLYAGTSGAYGSPHCKNYYWRTIAHNSLLVYDPDEKFSPRGDFGNDGGQRLPNNRYEPLNLESMLDPDKGYKTGEVLAHSYGPCLKEPDYTYIKGDITDAYSTKVKDVKRSFVFLNLKNNKVPAALIIFDKVVSSSPSFKKYWLLHSIDEPEIKGNEVTIMRREQKENGKLVNISLIPEKNNFELKSVGGPGKEFWVFGTNYENEMRDASGLHTYERAAWRIELSPKFPVSDNYFLNVMQVMENNIKEMHVSKIEGDKIIGVLIFDRIVFFSKNLDEINSSFTFSIKKDGIFKILITDLPAGKWKVIKDGEVIIPSINVRDQEGTLYFEGKKGNYSVIR